MDCLIRSPLQLSCTAANGLRYISSLCLHKLPVSNCVFACSGSQGQYSTSQTEVFLQAGLMCKKVELPGCTTNSAEVCEVCEQGGRFR